MAKYRDDQEALRHRAEQLEDELDEAETLIEAQSEEIAKLRARDSTHDTWALEKGQEAAVVNVGKVAGDVARYVTRGGTVGTIAAVMFFGFSALSVAASGPIWLALMMAMCGALFLRRAGFDIDLRDRSVTRWQWWGVRYSSRKLDEPVVVQIEFDVEYSQEGDRTETANLLLGGKIVQTSLSRSDGVALANEVSALLDTRPRYV